MEIIIADLQHLWDIQNLSKKLFLDDFNNYDTTLDIDRSHSKQATDFFTWLIKDPNSCIFLAIESNSVVWYICWWIYPLVSRRKGFENIGELYNIFVEEKYRNKNIGWELYTELTKWFQTKNINRVRVSASAWNISAINFYKKHWFNNYISILEQEI